MNESAGAPRRDWESPYFQGIVHGAVGLLIFIAGCIAIATWPWPSRAPEAPRPAACDARCVVARHG